jgi:hypothetical protein
MASSPLIAALLAPAGDSKKKIKDPKSKREKTGEKAPSMTGQQHGELQGYKEPTPHQRMKQAARDAKVHATRRWVEGELSNKAHAGIHARANRVLTGRAPLIKMPSRSKGNP